MVYCLSPGPAPALNAQPFGRGISMGGGVHQRPVAKEIRVCHLGKIADQKHEVKRINLQGYSGLIQVLQGCLKTCLVRSKTADYGASSKWENQPRAGAEGATAPETLRPQDRGIEQKSGERRASVRRRDSDLRQKDREGHQGRTVVVR